MNIFKKALPHLVAISTFIVLACVYFAPSFSDYDLKQSDIKQFQGMQKEIVDHNFLNEEKALWTDAMFGGMPSYQIHAHFSNNILPTIDKLIKLGLPRPVGLLFMAMLGFYILMLCLKINPWLGIVGAVGFGFSTINILYIGAGHVTKVGAIAYMAPTIGGLILAFRGKILLGGIVFALFFALNLNANHLQMTYYLTILLGAIALAETIRLFLQKKWVVLGKTLGVLALASLIAILPSFGNLSSTYQYSKLTTRGSTDLTIKPLGSENEKAITSGLNKDYILEYNYGNNELLSIIAPNAKGEKGDYIGNDEVAMEDVDRQYREQIAKMNRYWGGQRMSGGAFYFGVVMLVFALFGMIFTKDSIKWPLIAIGILTLLLASNNQGGVNDFFINKFPFYNKFRDSKMILVLLQVIIPAMGALFLNKLFFNREELYGNKKTWLISSGAVLLIILSLYSVPSLSGSFVTDAEVEQFSAAIEGTDNPDQIAYIDGLERELKRVRGGIYQSDFGRAIKLVILALGIILLSLYTKVSAIILTIASFVFVLGDNMSISKRYLDNEDLDTGNTHWEDVSRSATPYLPSPSDISILEFEKKYILGFDTKANQLLVAYNESSSFENMKSATKTSIAQFGALNLNSHYRVFSFLNTFNETNTSYFHKSIGGYHGAKLKRYQEMIDFHINNELQLVNKNIGAVKNIKLSQYAAQYSIPREQLQGVYDTIQVSTISLDEKTPVLNMLNTKHFITNRGLPSIVNDNSNGAVWFVNSIKKVKSANEEMLQVGMINSKQTAVVQENSFSVKGTSIKTEYAADSSAVITLEKYGLNELRYSSNSKTESPAIFSEIYYPLGWNCYVDNELIPDFRANYILRGAIIPAGKHTIVWRFEPKTVKTGGSIALIGSILLILGLLYILGKELKSNSTKQESEATN